MIYYTIYVKGLHNQTGYIDIALQSDRLLKDYLSYLDIGLKPHKPYEVADVGGSTGKTSSFAIDIETISAITVNVPEDHEEPREQE